MHRCVADHDPLSFSLLIHERRRRKRGTKLHCSRQRQSAITRCNLEVLFFSSRDRKSSRSQASVIEGRISASRVCQEEVEMNETRASWRGCREKRLAWQVVAEKNRERSKSSRDRREDQRLIRSAYRLLPRSLVPVHGGCMPYGISTGTNSTLLSYDSSAK